MLKKIAASATKAVTLKPSTNVAKRAKTGTKKSVMSQATVQYGIDSLGRLAGVVNCFARGTGYRAQSERSARQQRTLSKVTQPLRVIFARLSDWVRLGSWLRENSSSALAARIQFPQSARLRTDLHGQSRRWLSIEPRSERYLADHVFTQPGSGSTADRTCRDGPPRQSATRATGTLPIRAWRSVRSPPMLSPCERCGRHRVLS